MPAQAGIHVFLARFRRSAMSMGPAQSAERKHFFFEKKKQKTFDHSPLGDVSTYPAERLLSAIAALVPDLQEEAAFCDAAAQFPQAGFAKLRAAGLLTATLPEALGGAAFGEGATGALALQQLFQHLGEGSLAVARLYEAHVNALQLVLRYGSPALIARCAADAAAGHLFALWVTDPPENALQLEHGVLQGGKAFCSGAGVATRALVTAGEQMLIVALQPGTRVQPSAIHLSGMRGAITGAMDFTGMEIEPHALLGAPGDYLREPVFSAGAWRGAAAALGGLTALVKRHRNELTRRKRDADPHQRARFGQVVLAHETARLWLREAALRACLEDTAPASVVAYVNLARLAVESACLDAMRHTQRGLGLGAFIAGHPAERLCRDLATYLRQPAPDEVLDVAAAHYFTANLP